MTQAFWQQLNWMIPADRPVVIAPGLGYPMAGHSIELDLLAELGDEVARRAPNVPIIVAANGSNPVSGDDLLVRTGVAAIAGQKGRRVVDVAREPAYVVVESNRPVAIPALAFTPHTLITVAPLATHPAEMMAGLLAHHWTLFPDLLSAAWQGQRYELLAWALQMWSPDYCLLDARQVVYQQVTKLSQTTQLVRGSQLIAGNNAWDVDAAAAQLLGLGVADVPALQRVVRGAQSYGRVMVWPHDEPLPPAPLPSPQVYPVRVQERLMGETGRLLTGSQKLISKLDLVRVVDFVRRARGLSG